MYQATRLPKFARIVARLHSIELATAAAEVEWTKVDTLIVLSQHMCDRLQSLPPQSPPVMVIPDGVDLGRFRPQAHSFEHRIGMVCSLLPIKRIYEIILSLCELRQSGLPFTLHVAGRAAQGEPMRYAWALESLVRKPQLSDCVLFYGYVEDVASWLQGIDVFASNSYWEGQQVASLEATASGCYCLGHCWDSIEELLLAQNIYTTDKELQNKRLAYAALPDSRRGRHKSRCEPSLAGGSTNTL